MDGPNNTNAAQPDPLLKPGAFIDPGNPTSNGNGKSKREPVRPKQPSSDQKTACSVDVTDEINRPDWLPSGWTFKEFLRTSGASAGTKDKYFIDPVTSRRFRSKKEVFRYLETGTTPQQKRKADSDADNVQPSETPNSKRKKSEPKPKASIKNFNFDDIPEKVKWVLTDSYKSTWEPIVNGVDIVPEATEQEWHAAFTYLTLQNGGGQAMF